MFVITLRKGGLKKLAAVAICGAVLCGSVVGVSALMKNEDAQETAASSKEPVSKIVTAEEVSSFLKGYGVEVDLASAQVNTVKVPKKWDDSFKAFNEVIREGGLDLSKAKGKKVDKWMALVPILSQNEEKVYAVVLVSKEKPIGTYLIKKPSGDVTALKAVAVTAPLTPEEIQANAGFDDEVLYVNDSAEANAAASEPVQAQLEQVPQDVAAANADAPIDEAAMPTE